MEKLDNNLSKIGKKELKEIYWSARCMDIKDKRLDKIKEALYELTNLCQYSYETYSDLLCILNDFSEETLKKITEGTFTKFYREFYKGTSGMPEDYDVCTELLILIYTNYKKINTYEEYNACCQYIGHLKRRKDKKMFYLLKRINPILGTLLCNYTSTIDYKTNEHNPLGTYYQALGKIESQLLIAFMMNVDNYGYLYQMPATITSLIIENLTEEQVIKISQFMQTKNTNVFLAKELLDICYFVYCNKDKFNINDSFSNQRKIKVKDV